MALWGKRAESQLQNYLKKGQQVFVSGELSQRECQTSDDTTKSSLELNANIIDLLGKRNEQSNAAQPQQKYQPTQADYPLADSYDDVPL